MGNEMGNNNTTKLKEGKNTTLNDQGTSLQETAHANEGTGETRGGSFAETKYYHEKEAWIDSEDPIGKRGTHSYGHTSSDGREQEETEVHPPAGSPRTDISSEAGGMQPASLSNELGDHENPTELDLKENILLTGNNQFEKYISTRKAEEGEAVNSILVSALTPYDPEPQNSVMPNFMDHDAEKFHANISDNFNSPNEFEDISGSNISCINRENDYQLEACTPDHLDGIFVSGINLDVKRKRDEYVSEKIASTEDKMPSDENFEIVEELVRCIIDTTIVLAINDVEQVHDGESIGKMTYRNIVLESQTEANPMADTLNISKKSCEDSNLMRKNFDSDEIADDHNLCGFDEELMRKPEIDETSQTDFLTGNSCTNNVVEILMSTCCDHTSNEDLEGKGAMIAGHANQIDLCNDRQNEASVKQFMEPEVEATIFERLLVEPSVKNSKNSKEELQDCMLKIELEAEKQVIEIKEKIEASIISQQKEEKETGEHSMSQILHVKEEANLLQTSSFPFQLPDQQQKSATGNGDAQNSSVSILKLKPESCSESSIKTASTFPPTSMAEETLDFKVDSAVENPSQEVPLNVTEATEVTTKFSSSVSAAHSTEVCRNVETYVFTMNNGEKGSAGRLSAESNPDNPNIHLQMKKSPSFNFDLRIEARSEESDKTPLLYQDKATTKSFSGQTLVSGQNPLLHAQNGQDSFQYEAMPVEEKVSALEINNSKNSMTPFLGLMKDDQDAHFGVGPKKQDNLDAAKKTEKECWNSASKEEGTTPPKVKEKHNKHWSSLFANCICCATILDKMEFWSFGKWREYGLFKYILGKKPR